MSFAAEALPICSISTNVVFIMVQVSALERSASMKTVSWAIMSFISLLAIWTITSAFSPVFIKASSNWDICTGFWPRIIGKRHVRCALNFLVRKENVVSKNGFLGLPWKRIALFLLRDWVSPQSAIIRLQCSELQFLVNKSGLTNLCNRKINTRALLPGATFT